MKDKTPSKGQMRKYKYVIDLSRKYWKVKIFFT